MSKLKKLHRTSALILGLFITAHLVNHLFALWGFQNHIAVMQSLRIIYRHPFIEPILLLAAITQMTTGLIFFWKRRHHRHIFVKIQRYSGLYLAFFLTQHVLAALTSRYGQQLDTNAYWASSVLIIWPYPLYYFPYYVLAPIAFIAHIAIALQPKLIRIWSRSTARKFAYSIVVISFVLTMLGIFALSGGFFAIDLPNEYVLP